MNKRKIILDCDPGHDDAIAILMAGKHPRIELLGITVVAGNQTIEKTVRNTLNMVNFLGLDVKVYQGLGEPLVRERQVIAADIHGDTGLDGPSFPPLTISQEAKHGVDYLIETLLASDGDITLVPTGPLTNIAMAMRREPRIVPKIKEIVLMGGAYQMGNTTPGAEFNILCDPEAAHVVFTSGAPVVMVGLDVTNQAQALPPIIERMKQIGNPASQLFVELMDFFAGTYKAVFDFDGGPLHDPICVAYLIDPAVITLKPMFTEIELRSEKNYGRTICDYFGVTGQKPNALVAVDINQTIFWDMVEACIRMYE